MGMRLIKKIIRSLYWKYAHDGDPWQTRLVIYHMKNLVASNQDALPKIDISGRFLFAQIEDNMNKDTRPFFTPVADIKIGGIIE